MRFPKNSRLEVLLRLMRRENTRKVPGKPDSFSARMGSGRVAEPNTVVFPEVDWEEAFPESLGIDSSELKLAIDYLAYQLADTGGLSEFIIIRSGYLIARGNDIDRKHNIWSVTKTFASTALGLLIDDGKCSLDTFAKDYEPLLGEYYSAVKLRHFANMTSGYDAVGYRETHAHTNGRGDWGPDPYDPDTPLFAPGTKFC